MKVVIELSGTESKEDLLATSNYLRELAGKIAPAIAEKKTDLDKLADAVVEATKVKGEEAAPVKTVSEHIAEERAKNRASRTKKVEEPAPAPIEEPEEAPAPVEEVAAPAPIEEPEEAPAPVEEVAAPAPIEEPEEAPAPVEEVAAPAPKAPAEPVGKPAKDETVHTVDECKQWAMKALNAKKRPLVQEAFEQVGATSFPTLKESMFAEFIEYISTRL